MSAKDFFTAIDMLDTYNKIMKIDGKRQAVCGTGLDTRELGRYRSYVYREKMLKREILELTQSRMRVEKLLREHKSIPEAVLQSDYRRGRSKMIDLWLELSGVMLKRRSLEEKAMQIPSDFVRKVVYHRYFKDTGARLHTWAQTADELELPMTGVQLRETVVKNLRMCEI